MENHKNKMRNKIKYCLTVSYLYVSAVNVKMILIFFFALFFDLTFIHNMDSISCIERARTPSFRRSLVLHII